MMERINSFLATLGAAYNRQGQIGKILIPALSLLVFCCLCSIPMGLLPLGSRDTAGITPSPFAFPTTDGSQPTPTALFSFGSPFPTLVVPTPLPTTPSPPTATQPPTPTVPTATVSTATAIPTGTSIPTATNVPATPTSSVPVHIVTVDKPAEFVDIQNLTSAPIDLNGWRLVSVMGNQSCRLEGVLQPNEVLRVWARRGDPGFDCRFSNNIWNDNQADPAVLYDPQGQEISRFP